MERPEDEDATIARVPVLAWLLPLVHLIRPSGRRSRLTWVLALLDVLVIAGLVSAAVQHRDDPLWIGHLGREPVPAVGFRAEPRGQTLEVVEVPPDSPASDAGLVPGDVILTIEDELVFDQPMLDRRVLVHPIGTTFRILVARDGHNELLEVPSGARWHTSKQARARVSLLRVATVVGVLGTLVVVAILLWRRKAPWAWAPLFVLGLLLAQGLLADQIGPLLAAVCVAILANIFVRRIRSDAAAPRATLKITLGTMLALPIVALRGFLVGLVVAYILDIPFPDLGAAVLFEAAAPWLTSALAVPVMEELVFRGLLLPTLARGMRPWAALVVTSLVFGTLHVLGPTNPGAATAYGFVLGYLRLRTGRILPCIVVHAAINAVALALGLG